MTTSSPRIPRTGTQSIERAATLLREIASRGQLGWGLRDLAHNCELDAATVHRILKCLVAERLVQQRSSDSRYFIGPLNFELGLSVPNRKALMHASLSALRGVLRVLPKTSAVVFLRSGDDCVCIGRDGHVAYTRAQSISQVGQRFVLLSKAAGIAVVGAMRADLARAVIARNRKRLAPFGAAHLARVDELVKSTQQKGYTLSEGVVWHGVNSIAMVFGPQGDPVGSVTVSASSSDQDASTMLLLLPELRLAAQALGAHTEVF